MAPSQAKPDDDHEAWFRLLETPGIGRETARRLLAAFGSPAAVLDAGRSAWRSVAGPAVADALAAAPPDWARRWAAVQQWRSGGADRRLIALGDPLYPPRLLQTADPPLLLYVQGVPARLAADGIAVVGSRHATPQGLDNARALGRALSQRGLVVFSGLAAGIDGAAHEGALDGDAGTVAVVGTGLDRVYPARHRELAHRIAERGALVSEYAPGTPPLAENFPQRNRILAGLSLGTLVVEAALRSGSLITARLAAEAGREVFAVPGSIQAVQSRGCHVLLRQGAKLVETAQDIFDELTGIGLAPAAAAAAVPAAANDDDAGASDPLLQAMGCDPVTIDALLARTGWPAAALTARLLELEFAGQVARMAGGLYQRRHTV